ncbi:hypothetical protein BDN70DRAFT_881647 [Pholiota conissans]|uniref:F-box domain-containing protein n=1 Tax=Pholiota conissans TaxID=109636 RepID=A0A9P5Z041_9AGAR|nr:hypothetical protein BDN70DRAFT_881647 [Pholiota conissans]
MYKILEVAKRLKTAWYPSDEPGGPENWTRRCSHFAVGGHCCSPCAEAASLDEQIHQAEKTLRGLRALRSSKNMEINEVHDPLRRLPVELAAEIFAYLVPLPMPLGYNPRPDEPDEIGKSMMAPVVLSAVCRAWRSFAHSIPQLWSTISISIDNADEGVPDLVHQWLSRSARLPLSIYLHSPLQCARSGPELVLPPRSEEVPRAWRIIDAINTYSDRWFYLSLAIPKHLMLLMDRRNLQAPILESLTLEMFERDDSDNFFDHDEERLNFGKTPNLQKLHMCAILYHNFTLDWEKVTHVEGSHYSVEMAFDLLRIAPSLKYFALEGIYDDLYEIPGSILRHENLVSLNLDGGGDHNGIDPFLAYIELPMLQELSSVTSRFVELYVLEDFIRRSSCVLKALKLTIEGEWLQRKIQLVDVLAMLPSLETLQLKCRYWDSGAESGHYPTTNVLQEMDLRTVTPFLPNLKTLDVKLEVGGKKSSLNMELLSDEYRFTISSEEVYTYTPSDVIRIKPSYLFYLLDPDMHATIGPCVKNGVYVEPASTIGYLVDVEAFLKYSFKSELESRSDAECHSESKIFFLQNQIQIQCV